jgi:hypothetical protein
MTDPQHVSLRDFFDEKFKALDEKATEIIELQKLTNGRVRAAEKAIAVLSWAYGLGAAVLAWLVVHSVKS